MQRYNPYIHIHIYRVYMCIFVFTYVYAMYDYFINNDLQSLESIPTGASARAQE